MSLLVEHGQRCAVARMLVRSYDSHPSPNPRRDHEYACLISSSSPPTTTAEAGPDNFGGAQWQKLTLFMQWFGGPPTRLLRFYVFNGHFDMGSVMGAGGWLNVSFNIDCVRGTACTHRIVMWSTRIHNE